MCVYHASSFDSTLWFLAERNNDLSLRPMTLYPNKILQTCPWVWYESATGWCNDRQTTRTMTKSGSVVQWMTTSTTVKAIGYLPSLDLRLHAVNDRLYYYPSGIIHRCYKLTKVLNLLHHCSRVNRHYSSTLPTSVFHWMTHPLRFEMSIVYLVHRLRLILGEIDETLDRVETRRGNSFRYSPVLNRPSAAFDRRDWSLVRASLRN